MPSIPAPPEGLSDTEVNLTVAKLNGWTVTELHGKVFLEHPVKRYNLDYLSELNVFDGSIGSKALCLDMMTKFSVTFHPAREETQQYGRCGSHQPVAHENTERVIFTVIAITFANQPQTKYGFFKNGKLVDSCYADNLTSAKSDVEYEQCAPIVDASQITGSTINTESI
tara:strand:+ start:1508 stop:2014 length:507 start_codon:yes stop_codon:yes gene_type:complete